MWDVERLALWRAKLKVPLAIDEVHVMAFDAIWPTWL